MTNARLFLDVVGRHGSFDKFITPPIKTCRKICEDFCRKARKRRRRVPKGTLGGADAALLQKDREDFGKV